MATILCIPLSATGHVNPSISLSLKLKENGHRVIFAIDQSWKGKLVKYGFEEALYEERESINEEDKAKFWSDFIATLSWSFRKSEKDKMHARKQSFKNFINIAMFSDKQIKNIIETVRPDIIIQDTYVTYPSVVTSGVPYVFLHSSNPLQTLQDTSLPPGCFGLPMNASREWQECREIKRHIFEDLWKSFNEWIIDNGCTQLNFLQFQHKSPYLNIHLYPKYLFEDYKKLANLDKTFMLIQHSVRQCIESLKIPQEFQDKPGSIIYLSLGSMASSDVELMKRLIDILSSCKHKVIISLGQRKNEYKLAGNMWGEETLPQLKVLEICDLFITHGGNNSFTEALYFGKPMIVMPLFGDQNDNAQRLRETNLGAWINPFSTTKEELLFTIDSMLNNKCLYKKLKLISNEMRDDTMEAVVDRITDIINMNESGQNEANCKA